MRVPGPAHPITIAPHDGQVIIRFAGEVVARSDRALVLREASYPPVFYIPREDVLIARFRRTAHGSHCPYKGDAAYFSLDVAGRATENAAWSYENPFPAVAAIRGHLAFYPQRVDGIEA